jgi:RNase adapter protein RapZ
MKPRPVRVVLVTGLSGAGKASALRALEDIGFVTMDNPPLDMIDTLVRDEAKSAEPPAGVAIGIDARSRGFNAEQVAALLARLKSLPDVEAEMVYVMADDATLLGRYTETRRRHPLAPKGGLADGIALERQLTGHLLGTADLVIDTTGLKPSDLRQTIECKFLPKAEISLAVSITSFAFPKGLPRDADMVFDARFLRNPHYDPQLRPRSGLDPEVARFVADDPDFVPFMTKITDLVQFALPRFVREGKKYATIAVGCTGGRHRSVHVAETLARALSQAGGDRIAYSVSVSHRELGPEAGRHGSLEFFLQDKPRHLDHPPESEDAAPDVGHRSPEIKR